MSPITTGGFGVSVMPSMNYLPASSLIPNYAQIAPTAMATSDALQQQKLLAANVAQIPNRAQMSDLALQLQQAQVAGIPLRQFMAQIEANKASQPVDTPEGTAISEVPRYPSQPMVDEEGNPVLDETGKQRMETPAGMDVTEMNLVKKYNPVTNESSIEVHPGKPLSTMEQQQQQMAQIAASQALVDFRENGKQYEVPQLLRYRAQAVADGRTNDVANIDAILARKAATPGTLPAGTTYGRGLEKAAIDAGLTMTAATELAKTPEGVDAINKLGTARKMAAMGRPDFNNTMALTPAQIQLVNAAKLAPVAGSAAPTLSGPFNFTVPNVTPGTTPAAAAPAGPPTGAIIDLLTDPSLAPYFDEKYGPGSAQAILSNERG